LTYEDESTLSGAVINDRELILLINRVRDRSVRRNGDESCEIVHINLRTGHFSAPTTSHSVRYVVADDQSVWFLPATPNNTVPFILNGVPCALGKPRHHGRSDQFQLFEYVTPDWRRTKRYIAFPKFGYAEKTIVTRHGEVLCVVRDCDAIYYRLGLHSSTKITPIDEANQNDAEKQLTEPQELEQGWIRITNEEALEQIGNPMVFWMHDNYLCSIELSQT
jgi:hypothetical protein